MCTLIILTLALSLSLSSGQLPNYSQARSPPSIPSPNSWQNSGFPSSGFSQYQPYRSPISSSVGGQYQTSPQLSTISQLSGYNRLQAAPLQNNPWSQTSGARGWSIPSPVSSYSSLTPQSSGIAAVNSPISGSTPNQIQGTPFQATWSINHQGPSSAQPQNSVVTQPQSYNFPAPVASPPAQNWSPPSVPVPQWSSPPTQAYRAASVAQWNPPPTQTYRAPSPASVVQWSPQPTQTYRAPSPAPVAQWSAPPTQTYRAPESSPLPSPPQSAPVTTYQSPQNAQNTRPAPVHYANIGPQLQGDYKFGYHTGDGGSFREETRLPDGTVQGAYGFIDGEGKQRVVRYRAGKDGFQAEGDDVPKGTPSVSDQPSAQPQQPSAPINIDEGAAFKSFSQG